MTKRTTRMYSVQALPTWQMASKNRKGGREQGSLLRHIESARVDG